MNTDMVCKQLQNWKIYVFAVNVFLLTTNALACHLLQCYAHVTCHLFFYFSEDRTEAKRTINHWFVEFSGWGLRRRGEGWSSDHLFIFSIATARSHEHT